MLDKIKVFFKWYGQATGGLVPKPEVKGAEKKAAEPPETKVVEAPEKNVALVRTGASALPNRGG